MNHQHTLRTLAENVVETEPRHALLCGLGQNQARGIRRQELANDEVRALVGGERPWASLIPKTTVLAKRPA